MFKHSRTILYLTHLDMEIAERLNLDFSACSIVEESGFRIVEFPSQAARDAAYDALYRHYWNCEPRARTPR